MQNQRNSKAVNNPLFELFFRCVFCAQMLGHLLVIAERIVNDLGADETNGYCVVMKNELNREENVPQIHVMAERKLDWPPG